MSPQPKIVKNTLRDEWQVTGDFFLATRHSTHVTISKNLHKLVFAKAGNGEKKFLLEVPLSKGGVRGL